MHQGAETAYIGWRLFQGERWYGFLIFGALCATYFVEVYLFRALGM